MLIIPIGYLKNKKMAILIYHLLTKNDIELLFINFMIKVSAHIFLDLYLLAKVNPCLYKQCIFLIITVVGE